MVLTVNEERVVHSLHACTPRWVQSSSINFLLHATYPDHPLVSQTSNRLAGLAELVRIKIRDRLSQVGSEGTTENYIDPSLDSRP